MQHLTQNIFGGVAFKFVDWLRIDCGLIVDKCKQGANPYKIRVVDIVDNVKNHIS